MFCQVKCLVPRLDDYVPEFISLGPETRCVKLTCANRPIETLAYPAKPLFLGPLFPAVLDLWSLFGELSVGCKSTFHAVAHHAYLVTWYIFQSQWRKSIASGKSNFSLRFGGKFLEA